MKLKRADAFWDRSNLNNVNYNFDSIEKILSSLQNATLNLLNDGKLTDAQFQDLQIALNELVKKGDVSVNDINTNLGKIGLSHLSEEVISAITGEANVNLIPEDGSVTTNKVADKAIEPNKTNFFFKSKNLFDNTKVTANKKANGSTGEIETKSGWYVSSMIPVKVGQTYSKNKPAEIVCYNNNSQYVTSYGNSTDSIKIPNNVAYIRLNILFENYIDFQLEANTVSTSYEKFGVFSNDIRVSSTNFENDSIVGEKLSDGSIDKTKTDFIQESNNLFNLENIEYDILLGLDGSMNSSINYVTSDYIQVDEGETYVTNEKYFGYIIYDKNKHLITGRGQDITGVNVPSGGYYIRLSILNKWLPNFKFYNQKHNVVGSYSIDFKNKPTITETFNEKNRFNKGSYDKNIKERDFEVVEIFKNASDFKAPTGRLIDSFERTYKDNVKSFRMNTLGNATSEMQIVPVNNIPLKGIQEFNLIVYIEDVSKLTQVQLIANKEGGGSWTRTVKELKNGWNFLRYYSQEGDLSNWTNAILFRIVVYGITGQPTELTICDLKAIRPDKGKIIMVNDHGYSNYKNIAHAKLKALGVPTTFALNPGRLGAPIPGASSILSQEEIDELAVDPYAEFSYHAWDPTQKASKDMTGEELKEEMAKCTHYLKKNALYPDYFWRAAFVQNLAPNHDALNEHMESYACYDESSRFDVYPFKSSYGINRKQIHNIPNASVDTFFEILEKTHCLVVFYTHDVSDGGGIHMTNAELDYFVNHVKKGVDNNWLEGTTYAQLRRRYKPDYGKKGEFDFYENI
ncbi:polysaccharide deacetylase family protein [Staphylococcus saprophyticus]|uniref:polysaccharide deacetylase family protein n=1 Tax=Staphylococcus saprophyticus TaxID=29385 RepID=UPI00115EE26F|nr:polysaccharide deacetylase family protein [Staphylococcus saprophyticus]MDW4271868.1 polysaccharide deacetylase family protein [Staphylococcus saprophyticus]TRL83024.1 polysaccharide deacetylase family protein [Staphylococcus saprophyticus]